MASFNQATVMGYVGDEPRITTTQNGRKVASFSMATTEKGYTKKDGTKVDDRTEWHNIVVWGNLAIVIERYVHKGSSLFVQGKLRTISFDGKDGIKRYMTEIEAETVQLCDKRQISQQTQVNMAQTQSNSTMSSVNAANGSLPNNSDNDDLPF